MDNDDVFFELRNEKGDLVARSGRIEALPLKFRTSAEENFTSEGFRNIYRKSDSGSVRIVVSEKNGLFQGNRSVQRACTIYFSLIPKFKQIETSQRQHFDAIIRRSAHNLGKFQKRFKDNFDRLISDKSRARPYSEFKDEVKRRIEGNTSIAAEDVCQMSHRAIDLDAQIETLRIIGGYADNTGAFLQADLSKAMYRLTNPFVDELRKKNIQIVNKIESASSSEDKVKVVHSLFNATIWQLLDNASKYVLPDTDIVITADIKSAPKKMMISMTSVCIDQDELEKIFLENYQGHHVKKDGDVGIGREGTGIGMFIVRKALMLMKAKISVKNEGFVKKEGEYDYCKHVFTIEFNK